VNYGQKIKKQYSIQILVFYELEEYANQKQPIVTQKDFSILWLQRRGVEAINFTNFYSFSLQWLQSRCYHLTTYFHERTLPTLEFLKTRAQQFYYLTIQKQVRVLIEINF